MFSSAVPRTVERVLTTFPHKRATQLRHMRDTRVFCIPRTQLVCRTLNGVRGAGAARLARTKPSLARPSLASHTHFRTRSALGNGSRTHRELVPRKLTCWKWVWLARLGRPCNMIMSNTWQSRVAQRPSLIAVSCSGRQNFTDSGISSMLRQF